MEGTTTAVDLSGLVSALTSAITPAQILGVLASVVGIGMTFFLMWFGIRKAVKIFTTAVQTGRIRI